MTFLVITLSALAAAAACAALILAARSYRKARAEGDRSPDYRDVEDVRALIARMVLGGDSLLPTFAALGLTALSVVLAAAASIVSAIAGE